MDLSIAEIGMPSVIIVYATVNVDFFLRSLSAAAIENIREKNPGVLCAWHIFFGGIAYPNFKTYTMDNKKNTGIQDDIRVDSKDPSEVEYLHQQYPSYSHEQIKEAIIQYGPFRADIIAFLDKK